MPLDLYINLRKLYALSNSTEARNFIKPSIYNPFTNKVNPNFPSSTINESDKTECTTQRSCGPNKFFSHRGSFLATHQEATKSTSFTPSPKQLRDAHWPVFKLVYNFLVLHDFTSETNQRSCVHGIIEYEHFIYHLGNRYTSFEKKKKLQHSQST